MVPLEIKCLSSGYFHPLSTQASIYHKWLRHRKNIHISSTISDLSKILKVSVLLFFFNLNAFVSRFKSKNILLLYVVVCFAYIWLPICSTEMVLGQLFPEKTKQHELKQECHCLIPSLSEPLLQWTLNSGFNQL